MKSKNKRKRSVTQTECNVNRCPYCGSPVVLRSATGIYHENKNDTKLYVCSKYPECDAYARVQSGTKGVPLSSMANGELRALRREAHRQFDKIYTTGLMNKQDAYAWLAVILAVPKVHAHIGQLGEYYCNVVIAESRRFIENNRTRQRSVGGYVNSSPVQMASGG